MPDPQTVTAALEAIKRYADYEYFFEKLPSPDWIKPLAAEGLFRDPPAAVRDGDYLSFPAWPESRYLKRMSAMAPTEVLDILTAIPETDNVRVQMDVVDAALAMPPALAAKLVPKIVPWVVSPYLLLPERVGQLVAHLAAGNESDPALTLAQALLSLAPTIVNAEDEGTTALSPVPRGRFDDWHYSQILRKSVPTLVTKDGTRALDLLSDLLAEAISIRRRGADPGQDLSSIWRPAVEDHPQNRHDGVLDALITAVRDSAEAIVRNNTVAIGQVVQRLEERRWSVFRRIALHLLRLFNKADRDLVRARLIDPELADDVGTFHEFWLLAREVFPELSAEDQARLLGILDTQRLNEEREGTPDAIKLARHWFHQRLTMLGSVLPPDWAQRLAALDQEFSPVQHPEFLSHHGEVRIGPSSPATPDELSGRSIEEIVSYLRFWQPPSGWMEASPEGLGRTLSSVVAESPERFAKEAERFRDLDPTYVRALLQGLIEARKTNRQFPWGQVLALCRWVIEQPREISGRRAEHFEHDPGWLWARRAAADLLGAGFDTRDGEVPFEKRTLVFDILRPLADDPEPTPEYETKYGGDNMDPVTLSINTMRGMAMHAIVRYALWIRRCLERAGLEHSSADGFNVMPEVREVLESHLEPRKDPSLAVRAVYGQWFPWLALLDVVWSREHVTSIFPTTQDASPLSEAAWHAYLFYGGTYDDMLDLLKEPYTAAIDRITDAPEKHRRHEDPDTRLVEHLMVFYWRGKLSLVDSESHLVRFYVKAPVDLRAHALAFVGRSLHNSKGEDISEDIIRRLQVLWTTRFEDAISRPTAQRDTELVEFGWWFASGAFPSDWAIAQLLAVLRLTRRIDWADQTVQQLVTTTESHLAEAIEALRLLIDGDEGAGHFELWATDGAELLSRGMRSADKAIRNSTTDVIHLAGAKGSDAFEHLLDVRPTPPS